MKDILQDIVAKTHALGFPSLVKVTGTEADTTVESMAEDRSNSIKFIPKVQEFGENVFGMPNLDKLVLKNLNIKTTQKLKLLNKKEMVLLCSTGIHFENLQEISKMIRLW